MMNICLKTYAKQAKPHHVVVDVQERLPARVSEPCQVDCYFQVEACTDYFLLTLDVKCDVGITCQRCLGHFQHDFTNQTKLAVCADDTTAERLMDSFECMIAPHDNVDLTEILTDELHLFLPDRHLDMKDCEPIMSPFIKT